MAKEQKVRKVFVSHHHEDAANLGELKRKLEPMGFQCFLAHEDIDPGERYLNRIEEEIQKCSAFLYVGSKDANESIFCQQEIGMAKASGKKIITTMTGDYRPPGFIAGMQAITYGSIDDAFCQNIYAQLFKRVPPPEDVEKKLYALGIKGFSMTRQENMIHLSLDNWNDMGYQTSFCLEANGETIGVVRIGYIGQTTEERTSDKLLNPFTHIGMPFFSRVSISSEGSSYLKPKQIESLRYLLNDTTLMSEDNLRQVSGEGVYKTSLHRNY